MSMQITRELLSVRGSKQVVGGSEGPGKLLFHRQSHSHMDQSAHDV
jgi:hypothetical protein